MKTKKEFMKRLQQLLLWKYNKVEIRETIQDYEKYFNSGKYMGKTEEKMCIELGNPLAIVREINIRKKTRKISESINRKATIRCIALITWLVLFIVSISSWCHGGPIREKLLFFNPIVIVLGWYIVGGKKFTKAWLNEVEYGYKPLKITILHSTFLIMAILSFALVSKAVTSWEIIYVVQNHNPIKLKAITLQLLVVFVVIGVIIMLLSIYEYRTYSMEYYSLICHGTGFIATMISYMNVICYLESIEWYAGIIYQCEWVYVESLVLASIFLIYCGRCRQIGDKKYSPY